MSEALLFLLLAQLHVPTVPVATPGTAQCQEKIEWVWTDRPDTIDPARPNVLLIGDSITRNAYPAVAADLAVRANVFLFSTSASAGDDRLDRQVAEYFRATPRKFAVVYVNNGLHGWCYSEAAYARRLPSLLAAIRRGAPAARLIWGNSTPIESTMDGGGNNSRIDTRNRAAAALMARRGIPIDDRHTLVAAQTAPFVDGVHLTPAVVALQARQAGARIAAELARSGRGRP